MARPKSSPTPGTSGDSRCPSSRIRPDQPAQPGQDQQAGPDQQVPTDVGKVPHDAGPSRPGRLRLHDPAATAPRSAPAVAGARRPSLAGGIGPISMVDRHLHAPRRRPRRPPEDVRGTLRPSGRLRARSLMHAPCRERSWHFATLTRGNCRLALWGLQRRMRAMDARRAYPRPRPAALATALAAAVLLSATAAGAASRPAPVSAPLDTLHVVAPPSPYDSADATMGLSRNLLPDIEATSLPRVKPPQQPPRLDDPVGGEARFLAARRAARAGDDADVQQLLDDAVQKGTEPSRLRWWQLSQALRDLDPVTIIWALPKSLRAAWNEPLAAPRLLILAHQGALQLLAIFWTLLLVAYYAVYWRFLAHDLAARILRDHRQRVPGVAAAADRRRRPRHAPGLARACCRCCRSRS